MDYSDKIKITYNGDVLYVGGFLVENELHITTIIKDGKYLEVKPSDDDVSEIGALAAKQYSKYLRKLKAEYLKQKQDEKAN